MIVLGSFVIFLAAAGLIFLATFQGLRLAGMASNANRPRLQRRLLALGAAGAFAGCFAAAGAGFAGITALWWAVQRGGG